MRQSSLLVAALLTFTMGAPRVALAFDIQPLGTGASGTAQNYADPFGYSDPKLSDPDDKLESSTGSKELLPGLHFSGSVTGSRGAGYWSADGWQNPQGGRHTQ
jgi:hypothetical protein